MAAVLQSIPLAVRRRWTLLCLTLVSLGFALDQLRAYHLFAGAALPIVLINAGSHQEKYRRATQVTATLGYVAMAVGLNARGGDETLVEYVTFYLVLALAWGIGAWMRSARAAEAERRSRVAEDARNAERTRIARELHDVVTHHVTAMVVQSEAARYLTAAPERLDESLAAVSDTGRGPSPTCGTCSTSSTPTTAPPSPGHHPSAGCSRWSSRPAGPGSRWSSPRRAPRRRPPAAPTSWPTVSSRRP